ncbi:MAG: hypothetical protein IJX78_07495 [Bacilli bacterium]|nr:hypothetical protein [Bacilli bacterium]
MNEIIISKLIGLSRCIVGNEDLITSSTIDLIIKGLTIENSKEDKIIQSYIKELEKEKMRLVPNCYNCMSSCGKTNDFDFLELELLPSEIKELKIEILNNLYKFNNHSFKFIYESLFIIGLSSTDKDTLQNILNKIK